MNEEPYPEIDLSEVLDRMMEDRSLLAEVLGTYLDNPFGGVKAIEEALKQNNWDEATLLCHSLKGVAANLSLTEVGHAAVALEAGLKTNPREGLAPLVVTLREADARARARVRSILGRD